MSYATLHSKFCMQFHSLIEAISISNLADMLRLRVQEPDVGLGDVRHLHLHRLLGHPPLARRPPHLRPLHAARPQLDVAADPPDAVRRQLQCSLLLPVSLKWFPRSMSK